MINFTVGPVQMADSIRAIGTAQIPYFRTHEFSSMMKENETLIKKFAKADSDASVIFLSASGTAAMEAAVINMFTAKDRVLIINGGTFGQRFADLCTIHEIPYEQITPGFGKALTEEMLLPFERQGYTGLLVNLDETSCGVLYDAELISNFCKRNKLFWVCDCISSFLTDPFDMKKLGVNLMITSSQKALACPPGVSIIVLSSSAIQKAKTINPKTMYLNLKLCLENMKRGQTPFTPAVGILHQINARLKEIENNGGVETEISKCAFLAKYFRERIKDFPFDFISDSPTNAVTALHPRNISSKKLFKILKNEYGIWICPNGGEMAEQVFRIGHIGALSIQDYDQLLAALRELHNKGIL